MWHNVENYVIGVVGVAMDSLCGFNCCWPAYYRRLVWMSLVWWACLPCARHLRTPRGHQACPSPMLGCLAVYCGLVTRPVSSLEGVLSLGCLGESGEIRPFVAVVS